MYVLIIVSETFINSSFNYVLTVVLGVLLSLIVNEQYWWR